MAKPTFMVTLGGNATVEEEKKKPAVSGVPKVENDPNKIAFGETNSAVLDTKKPTQTMNGISATVVTQPAPPVAPSGIPKFENDPNKVAFG